MRNNSVTLFRMRVGDRCVAITEPRLRILCAIRAKKSVTGTAPTRRELVAVTGLTLESNRLLDGMRTKGLLSLRRGPTPHSGGRAYVYDLAPAVETALARDPTEGQKRCSTCRRWLPATTDHFFRKASSRDGLQACCRACNAARKARLRAEASAPWPAEGRKQ